MLLFLVAGTLSGIETGFTEWKWIPPVVAQMVAIQTFRMFDCFSFALVFLARVVISLSHIGTVLEMSFWSSFSLPTESGGRVAS